jgi:hypothetical protein
MAETKLPVVGSTPTVTASFRTLENGVLVLKDPTSVVVTVEDPDGAQTSPAVTNESTGVYSITFTLTQAGRWHYQFVGDLPAPGLVEGDIWAQASNVDAAPDTNYTYDLGTDIGVVRELVDDHDFTNIGAMVPPEQRSCIFTDPEIQVFLTLESTVYRAAGVALLTIATNRQLLVQRRELDGATVDFGSLRSDLRASAKMMFDLSDELSGENSPADAIAEQNWNEFTERDIIWNSWLRQGY